MDYYRYHNASFQRINNPLYNFPPDGDFYNEPYKAGYKDVLTKHRWDQYLLPMYSIYQNTGTHPELPLYFVEFNSRSDRVSWYFAEDRAGLIAVMTKFAPEARFTESNMDRLLVVSAVLQIH
jgi:hypothetical protein